MQAEEETIVRRRFIRRLEFAFATGAGNPADSLGVNVQAFHRVAQRAPCSRAWSG